jgi:hypothetical protein
MNSPGGRTLAASRWDILTRPAAPPATHWAAVYPAASRDSGRSQPDSRR